MKLIAGLLAGLAVLCAGALLWLADPWASEDETVDRVARGAALGGSGCRRLAGLASQLAAQERTAPDFLRAFGRDAAGIRNPPLAFGDLARGGRNRIAGRGFRARFDDGTGGQARHFAGIAVATSFGGGAGTRLISIFVRDDPGGSPDGRLTDEGIAFATGVLAGKLALEQTPAWLLEHLCRRS